MFFQNQLGRGGPENTRFQAKSKGNITSGVQKEITGKREGIDTTIDHDFEVVKKYWTAISSDDKKTVMAIVSRYVKSRDE